MTVKSQPGGLSPAGTAPAQPSVRTDPLAKPPLKAVDEKLGGNSKWAAPVHFLTAPFAPTDVQRFIHRTGGRHPGDKDSRAFVDELFALSPAAVERPGAAAMLRESLSKAVAQNPGLVNELANRLRRVDGPPSAIDDVAADLLCDVDFERFQPIITDIKRRRLMELQHRFVVSANRSAEAWSEQSEKILVIAAAVRAGGAKLTPGAAKKLLDDAAKVAALRRRDLDETATLASAWVSHLLKPATSRALGALSTQLVEDLAPGLVAMQTVNKRLRQVGLAFEPQERLGAALRQSAVELDAGSAKPTYPQLATVLTAIETETADTLNADNPKAGPIDRLRPPLTRVAKANWSRDVLTTALSAALENALAPQMTLQEVRALSSVGTRAKQSLARLGANLDGVSPSLKRFTAALAVVNMFCSYADWKAGSIGNKEFTGVMGFYVGEVLEWAAITKYGSKLIEVPLEKTVTNMAMRFLEHLPKAGSHGSKLAANLGSAAARNLIPVVGCLFAAGATYYELERAISAGDPNLVAARAAEMYGWGALGAGIAVKSTAVAGVGTATVQTGTATTATGVGAPVGLTLMVLGSLLIAGSYTYDLFYAPNEVETMARSLGYELA